MRGGKVDIGRIDLMRNYSYIEVAEDDAERVIEGLSDVRVHGRRISVEVADTDGSGAQERKADKAHADRNDRRERGDRNNRRDRADRSDRNNDRADRSDRRERKEKPARKDRPSREERGYTTPRGKQYKKEDWMKFLHPEQKELQGSEPDFSEEGWARRFPKKK